MNSVILIIDVQTGMFKADPPVFKGQELLHNTRQLLSFSEKKGIPVIFVQHSGPINSPLELHSEGWKIHNSLKPRPQDHIIHKETPDCFYKTRLQEYLNQLNAEHLIIAGIQTEACVDTACRIGFSQGYKVTLITDAHSTFDKNMITAQQIIDHHNEVLRWFAQTMSTKEFISS
jgi:nicotinamidase-related amidase